MRQSQRPSEVLLQWDHQRLWSFITVSVCVWVCECIRNLKNPRKKRRRDDLSYDWLLATAADGCLLADVNTRAVDFCLRTEWRVFPSNIKLQRVTCCCFSLLLSDWTTETVDSVYGCFKSCWAWKHDWRHAAAPWRPQCSLQPQAQRTASCWLSL